MRQHLKRTCHVCHKWKKKSRYGKHKRNCMGGKPLGDTALGGTGKEASYKKKQKEGKKGEEKNAR